MLYSDSDLKALIEKDEGRKRKPYLDTKGKISIGVGRNLSDRGLSDLEIDYLFENDLKMACNDVDFFFPWANKLSKPRQMVLIDMCFNLGVSKLRAFHKMLLAAAHGDFETAATEMLDSEWAHQVGDRARLLSEMMRRG
jgi:lysozyme